MTQWLTYTKKSYMYHCAAVATTTWYKREGFSDLQEYGMVMTKCNVWKKQRWIYCSPLLVLLVLLYVSPAFYSNCNYIDAYMPSILQALFGIPGSINVGQSLDSMVRQILRHTYLAIQITLYWNSKLRRRLECFPSESRAPSQRGVIDTLGLMRLMLRSISSNPKRLCLVVYPEGKRSVEWQKAPLIGTIDWMRPAEYGSIYLLASARASSSTSS